MTEVRNELVSGYRASHARLSYCESPIRVQGEGALVDRPMRLSSLDTRR